MARNPERTTKAERRAAKRWNPLAARTFGIAEAARYMRLGILLDEAEGLDRLALAVLHDRLDGAGTLMVPASMALPETDNAALAAWAKTTAEAVGNHILDEAGLGDRYTVVYDTTTATAPVGAPPFDTGLYQRFAEARTYRDANPHMKYHFEPHIELYRGDPNEAAAARAEAIENALADDFNDEDDHDV